MTDDRNPESGHTIVEALVAIVVFSLVSVALYQVLMVQTNVIGTTRSIGRIADEARLGYNRMVRDIREADAVSWVSATGNQFTINVNYDGNGYYESPNTQGDDEVLTYTYDPVAETVTLCAAAAATSCNATNTEILMAGTKQVGTTPVFTFTSNNLSYDWGAPSGVTTWDEIDEASDPATHNIVGVGNDNGVLDAGEFPFLTTVSIAMRQSDGDRETDFFGRVHMRNRT